MTCVLVTGGSGRLGKALLGRLVEAGFEVRATSRRARPATGGVRWFVADLTTGQGLAEGVTGAEVIVHLAAAPYRGRYTLKVELDGTAALLAAARAAGIRHLIYLSIVGADRVPWGYFRTKVRAERLVQAGGVPWTTVRVTQFHEFLELPLRAMARLPVMVMDPDVLAQPVDVRDVAAHLVELVRRGPGQAVEEFGGPEVLRAGDALEEWLRVRGGRRRVLRLRLPGELGRAARAGRLTTKAGPAGGIAWRDYLRGA